MHEKDVNWKEQYEQLWLKISRNHHHFKRIEHELRVLVQDLELMRNEIDPYQGTVVMLEGGELVVRAL